MITAWGSDPPPRGGGGLVVQGTGGTGVLGGGGRGPPRPGWLLAGLGDPELGGLDGREGHSLVGRLLDKGRGKGAEMDGSAITTPRIEANARRLPVAEWRTHHLGVEVEARLSATLTHEPK